MTTLIDLVVDGSKQRRITLLLTCYFKCWSPPSIRVRPTTLHYLSGRSPGMHQKVQNIELCASPSETELLWQHKVDKCNIRQLVVGFACCG